MFVAMDPRFDKYIDSSSDHVWEWEGMRLIRSKFPTSAVRAE